MRDFERNEIDDKGTFLEDGTGKVYLLTCVGHNVFEGRPNTWLNENNVERLPPIDVENYRSIRYTTGYVLRTPVEAYEAYILNRMGVEG